MSDGPALVVGLGNPGAEYRGTRHNLGFEVVDLLARRSGVSLRAGRGVRALIADMHDRGRKVMLAQPTTFMNLSGDAVRELARYHKVDVDDVVIVHDDLDLELGVLRVKRGGGDGGHNGLKHITRALGSKEYARVRLGIGRPPGRQDAADYVLRRFTDAERAEADLLVEHAADATLIVVHEGVDAAQARYHAGESKPAPPTRAITKERTVAASMPEVWHAWTTTDGARTFFAPEARIELRPRGPYELLFDPTEEPGSQGSEGCTVVAFEPERFLVFTWNAPPHLPDVRRKRTRVEVRLEQAEDGTKVRLTHTGWRSGPQWDEAFEYFERAWEVVLDRLVDRFTTGPITWRAPG